MSESVKYTQVSEIMVNEPIVATPETSIIEIARMMKSNSVGSIIIVQEDKATGIITERDLVHKVVSLGDNSKELEARDIMSKPVITVRKTSPLDEAILTMKNYKIKRLVVTDEEENVTGILSINDIGYNLPRMAEEIGMEYYLLSRTMMQERSRG
jgi:signal-transduction protein with cAMP-binding, CBS, and nucleotidyltransferase domain